MKKVILIAALIFISAATFAQLSVGVQAIGNLSDATVKNPVDFDFKRTMKLAPGGGIVAQYDLSSHFIIRSGVNYLQHAVELEADLSDDDGDLKVKAENRLHYVQVPLTVMYGFPVGQSRIYAGAGGYFNYGFSGKSKGTVSYVDDDDELISITEDMEAFKKEEEGGANLKRAEFGVTAIAGIELKNGLFINAGYQLGLTNSDRTEDSKYKNRGLQLTVGYLLRLR